MAVGAQAQILDGEKQPDTLKLVGKLRDFLEINAVGAGPVHPDFNSNLLQARSARGLISTDISVDGKVDASVFPHDNRNPALIAGYDGKGAYTSADRFNEWYDDRDASVNRPFLMDLNFKRNAQGLYEYDAPGFFPLDEGGGYRNLPGDASKTFGQIQNCCKPHVFGFTMEFHAYFTYLAGKAQVFNFRGDDDTWIFINDKLAIDLGGIHPARAGSVDLDKVAATLGLKDHQAYMLDFFIAERHTNWSSCQITTSLVLGTRKVSTPVATPASSSFNTQIAVSLASATPDAEIHYTLDGRDPDAKSPLYDAAKPFLFIGTATLKAIGMKPDWNPSEVMTAVYSKNRVASALEVLDANGIPLAGRALTGLDAGYQVRVQTTQAGLSRADASATTKTAGDRESLGLPQSVLAYDRFTFTAAAPFSLQTGAAKANDGATQAAAYDSLTVRWVNPMDSVDAPFQKIAIRPAAVQARAWFSTRADGGDTVDQYRGTETRVYLAVRDEILPAGTVPSLAVETAPRIGSGRKADKESLTLKGNPAVPGLYVFAIDLALSSTAVIGDGKIQVVLEDMLKATYLDPMDAEDPAVATAGFGIAPEIEAVLQFTDKAGTPWPAGAKIDPATGFLYLSFTDDWVNGQIGKQTAVITIVNQGGISPGDSESLSLDLAPARHTGSTGVWVGAIPLRGSPEIAKGNGRADTYILGQVSARVASHDKLGTAGSLVSDAVEVAYPDQEAVLGLEGTRGPGAAIGRDEGSIRVTLKDQSFSDGIDTLHADLSCGESRDRVADVLLIEKSGEPGTYVSVDVPKAEGAAIADGTLQCSARDMIKAGYADPVYGGMKEVQVLLDEPISMNLRFSRNADGSDTLSVARDAEAGSFYAILRAQSPSAARVDTLAIVMTTPQGERETFRAVETGAFTHTFVARIPFAFAAAFSVGNGSLEGRLDPALSENRVTATGTVTLQGAQTAAAIILISAYISASHAWIKDMDGDGAADRVCVEFSKRLPRLPAGFEAQWNREASSFLTPGTLSFLDADSLIVMADYSGNPYPAGLTSIPSGQSPKARLPVDALFQGRMPALEDSIGPVILAAEKHPHDLNTLIPNDPAFFHDTLYVTVSEALKAATDSRQMLKFAISCSEYAQAITVSAISDPTVDAANPLRYRVILDNSAGATPQAGNCVFLNADAGKFSDLQGNSLPRHGVTLEGINGRNVIQEMRGFPPVAGLDPNKAGYQVAVQDTRDADRKPYSTQGGEGWQVLWIPPVGFQEGRGFDPYRLEGFDRPGRNERETATPVEMPKGISAIQVVATSAYVAQITIFDMYGNVVAHSVQAFGGRGELNNLARATSKGMAGFLIWDQKDRFGQKAGQGVYVWKVLFRFETGKNEVRYVRTGLVR